ncbi:hypothetical protein RMSM_05520 [Rhodopirellula maiorica SM1]|uniref:Uncharacterized protein n=1 Tax=Rhodopirellula maiorica SM1 TaxID=1265738 RepID=M5RDJ8_9BACT|nr:hypothetical protein [Rhodopirellula maiorica]EMI17553.1 hypothetical protein RMSM_05520 [Rhodopirellula maiorica SM1]
MSKKKKKNTRIPHKFLPWIDARKKYRLSHAQVQMARELGMSPKRFDRLANTEHKPWKVPLPQFIESLYEKKFGKPEPDHVQSIEEMAAEHMARREARKAAKVADETAEEHRDESTDLQSDTLQSDDAVKSDDTANASLETDTDVDPEIKI